MKPIISLIDFIMIKEGKKTLKFIKDESLKTNANEETLLKILKDNKDTEYGKNARCTSETKILLWLIRTGSRSTKYQLATEIRTSFEVFSYFLLMISI